MKLHRGDVVLIPFPFTDLSARKVRPALVLSETAGWSGWPDLVLAAITSRLASHRGRVHVPLLGASPGFARTGLRADSAVLPYKLVTLDQSLVVSHLGRIDHDTQVAVDAGLRQVLALT